LRKRAAPPGWARSAPCSGPRSSCPRTAPARGMVGVVGAGGCRIVLAPLPPPLCSPLVAPPSCKHALTFSGSTMGARRRTVAAPRWYAALATAASASARPAAPSSRNSRMEVRSGTPVSAATSVTSAMAPSAN